MYNIIMDIDQTVVDSRCAKEIRGDLSNKDKVLDLINSGKILPYKGIVEAIYKAHKRGHDIVFVSNSRRYYCEALLRKIGLAFFADKEKLICFEDLEGNKDGKKYPEKLIHTKAKMYYRAILYNYETENGWGHGCKFYNRFQPYLIVGDGYKDINGLEELRKYIKENKRLKLEFYTVRCLWGVTNDEYNKEENHGNTPFMIIENIEEFDNLLNYTEYLYNYKTDENNVRYCFNYYPTGNGGYHDIITEYLQKGLKNSDYDDESMFYKESHYFMENWICLYLTKIIRDMKEKYGIENNQLGLFIIPSSREGIWNNVLKNIIDKLSTGEGCINCSEALYRHTSVQPKHLSNEARDIDADLESIELQNCCQIADISLAIIIDDITTSGTSFEACKKILGNSGSFNGQIECVAVSKTKHIKESPKITEVESDTIPEPDLNDVNKHYIEVNRSNSDSCDFGDYYHFGKKCKFSDRKEGYNTWFFESDENYEYSRGKDWFAPHLKRCKYCKKEV